MRLDPLPYTEDYFAVYNGVVILSANPYFSFAREVGLGSVATDNYSPKGARVVITVLMITHHPHPDAFVRRVFRFWSCV